MKEINLPSGDYLFVEMPKSTITFTKTYRSSASFEGYVIQWNLTAFSDNHTKIKNFKDFEIISTTKDITEEQCIQYLTGKSYLYSTDISGSWEGQVYSCDEDEETIALTAKKSLQSLIQANGLDVNKNYLILLKK